MTSLHYINRAFDLGQDLKRYHPVQGYHWESDEKAIAEAREDMKKAASVNSKCIISSDDAYRKFEYRNQLDSMIMNTFQSELEPLSNDHEHMAKKPKCG
jgi:hypothetical protein